MAATSKPKVEATKTNPSSQKLGKKAPSFSDVEEFVTFLIGPSTAPKKFLVHKSFVCNYSPVLKAAFNSTFVEGQTQIYKLDDTTNDTFTLFVQWIYKQTLENPTEASEISKHWAALTRLWVLAEKILIPHLQNQVLTNFDEYRKSIHNISTSEIPFIYENTKVGSPLRTLIVNHCAWYIKSSMFLDYPTYFPQEMLLDLLFASGTLSLLTLAIQPGSWRICTSRRMRVALEIQKKGTLCTPTPTLLAGDNTAQPSRKSCSIFNHDASVTEP